MIPTAAGPLVTGIFVALATSAVRALALGGAAGLGLAAFGVKSTSVRLFTWTAVLYAALAMPLLERMLPSLPVSSPAFLQSGYRPVQSTVDASTVRTIDLGWLDVGLRARNVGTATSVGPATSRGFDWRAIRWNVVAAEIYLVVALFLFLRLLVGMVFGRRLRRASQIICDTSITARLAYCARAAGPAPQAAESDFISVPVTMGVLRPVILLPANWREWDDAKLDAVIAHEVSHIARRDTLTQRVALLHCAIFWFSPLAWWLNRHLADLMERASDEAALASGADIKAYATTLLGFFEALQGAPQRVWWQGVSMATAGRAERQAEERVERILRWKGAVAMNLRKSIAVMVVALAVPIVYVTASAHPAGRNEDSPTPGLISAELAQGQTSSSLPAAAEVVLATTKSPTSTAQGDGSSTYSSSDHSSSKDSSSHHSFYSYGNDEEQSFVIVSGKSDSLTMSGTGEDAEHVNGLRKKIPGDFVWFRRDEKSYIIRDQGTIDRARAFWAPQEELGKKQEALGKQQEALGTQQEELGKKMEQVQVKVPDLTQQLVKLQAELKQMSSGATVEQVGHIQSEIGELQSRIGEVQSQAGEQQSKLGEQMSALGEKQGKLGEQQGELGRQQGELAKQASRQMKQLLDDAIKNGTAQPER
jgi:beta-lactamase regulating signal transducer with metallopeptidase domain